MSKYCSNCGRTVRYGAVFCTECGKVVSEFDRRTNSTFFTPYNRTDPINREQRIVCDEYASKNIEVNCKILNVSVNSTDTDSVEVLWRQTGSWGLLIEQSEECLRIREQSYLGIQNISDIFLSSPHRQVEINIPRSFEGNVVVYTDAGKIEPKDLSIQGDISMTAGAGRITAGHVDASGSIYFGNSVGGIVARDVCAGINLSMKTTIGNIDAYKIDSGKQISIETQTGQVNCTIDDEEANYRTEHYSQNSSTPRPDDDSELKDLYVRTTIGPVNVRFMGNSRSERKSGTKKATAE